MAAARQQQEEAVKTVRDNINVFITVAMAAGSLLCGYMGSYVHQAVANNTFEQHLARNDQQISELKADFKTMNDKWDQAENRRTAADLAMAGHLGAIDSTLDIMRKWMTSDGTNKK